MKQISACLSTYSHGEIHSAVVSLWQSNKSLCKNSHSLRYRKADLGILPEENAQQGRNAKTVLEQAESSGPCAAGIAAGSA